MKGKISNGQSKEEICMENTQKKQNMQIHPENNILKKSNFQSQQIKNINQQNLSNEYNIIRISSMSYVKQLNTKYRNNIIPVIPNRLNFSTNV